MLSKALYIHIHQRKIRLLEQTNACSCECMTYLLTLLHHNAYGNNEWTYECMFITLKQEKENKP